jgi:hypothetical protein
LVICGESGKLGVSFPALSARRDRLSDLLRRTLEEIKVLHLLHSARVELAVVVNFLELPLIVIFGRVIVEAKCWGCTSARGN